MVDNEWQQEYFPFSDFFPPYKILYKNGTSYVLIIYHLSALEIIF